MQLEAITQEELRKLEILEDEEYDLETEYEQYLVSKGKKFFTNGNLVLKYVTRRRTRYDSI